MSTVVMDKLLAEMEIEAATIAGELYTERLVPVLRKVAGFSGEMRVVAQSKMKVNTVSGHIDNALTLSLVFEDKSFVDPFETAQRIIVSELFNRIVQEKNI